MKHEIKSYSPIETCKTPLVDGYTGEVRECSCGRIWLFDRHGRYRKSSFCYWLEMTGNKHWIKQFKKEMNNRYE